MKSGYMIKTDYCSGTKMYVVCQLKDATLPDTESNLSEDGSYKSKSAAQAKVDELNKRAAESFWKSRQ